MFRTHGLIGVASLALLSSYLVGCGQESKSPTVDTSQKEAVLASETSSVAATERASRRPGSERNSESAVNTAQTSKSPIELAQRPALARNVILFVGDGMGVSTVTAARIHAGQRQGRDGESHVLSFERFPELALIKTYNFDAQVPDSAGTATQMMGGYRTRIGQINILPEPETPGPAATCDRSALPPTLLSRLKTKNKRVGIVTTARVTHATPAALYGHAYSRGWESPSDIPDALRESGCASLAEQLASSELDLVMGGGRSEFIGVDTSRFQSASDLGAMTLPALGLFGDSHMNYDVDRKADEPSLAEMTAASITALETESGYFLLVEAGRIDHAHHGTNAYRALEDTVALDVAVEKAVQMTSDDTLILVTADHSHVMTIQGYPARNNPILGLMHGFDGETRLRNADPELADDGKPYTTLSYANGPVSREDADYSKAEDPDFRQPAMLSKESETHAGEDVPLYATGPGSDAVGGVMDQTEISRVIRDALGLD